MKKRLPLSIIFFLSISFLFFSKNATAQPYIRTIAIDGTSTLSNGQTLTISGSGFGVKNPAAPRVWTNFEDGTINPSSLGTATSWARSSGFSISNQNQETNSTYNVRGLIYDGTGTTGYVGLVTNYADSGDSQGFTKVYAFVRRNYADPDWWNVMTGQYHNYKFFRLWTNPVGVTSVYPDSFFVIGNTVPKILFATEGPTCKAADDSDSGTGTTTPSVQQWLREEYAVSRGNGNGVAKMWSNGTLVKNLSNLYTASGFCDPSPYTDSWISISIENYWNLVPPPVNAYIYFDDVYLDNTWARVMIGDQNTFDASTHREIQIPTAWSDTSVTVTINQGSFTTLSGSYLYIIDADGNVNANGYPLCPTCLKPPTGFQTN